MLVRFLSFVASVIGTARYKAVLLSLLALVISLISITVVALAKNGMRSHSSDSSAIAGQEYEVNASVDSNIFKPVAVKVTIR